MKRQRVSIDRALVGQPAILLADEPTGALDQTSGREVLKLFRELNDMGNTIVMITHDLGVAQRNVLCVLWMGSYRNNYNLRDIKCCLRSSPNILRSDTLHRHDPERCS